MNKNYVGIHFMKQSVLDEFFVITCPCGVKHVYPINKLPEVDTLSDCGNPNHYIVKYDL